MDFTYIHIDRSSPELPRLAQKFKELRLTALKLSPGSFSATYETESALPDDVWITRLSDPRKETFICAAVPAATADSSTATTNKTTSSGGKDAALSAESEWVAQMTLLGPVSADAFRLPPEAGQPAVAPDTEEEKWQMMGLYTLPTYRGRSLAKKLCQHAFDYLSASSARSSGGGAPKVRVRIMVKPENQVTVRMYSSLGFVDAGRCTLEEALRANEEADSLPPSPLGPKYTTRGGIIMALVFDRR